MSSFSVMSSVVCGVIGMISTTIINVNGADIWAENEILPENLQEGLMGYSVSISGNMGVIGHLTSSNDGSGSVYVIQRDDTSVTKEWSILEVLTGSDTLNGDGFGESVFIDGNNIIIGSPLHTPSPGSCGAAYIFTYDENNNEWSELTKIYGSTSQSADLCGTSVSISGNSAIIGCPGEGLHDAKVFIYENDDINGWTETAVFTGDWFFGNTVSIYNNLYAIAGNQIFKRDDITNDWNEVSVTNQPDISSTGTSVSICNEYAFIGDDSSVYVFKNVDNLDGTEWTLMNTLSPSDSSSDNFGGFININCDENDYYVGITASKYDTDIAWNAGAVYIYSLNTDNNNWEQSNILTLSNGESNEYLQAVGVDGDCIIAGAPFRDYSSLTGSAGAVSVFCRDQYTSESCANAAMSLSNIETNKFDEYYMGLESNNIYNHFYTTIENPSMNSNYEPTDNIYEGYLWYHETEGITVPLYRQYSRTDKNHYYTTSDQLWDISSDYFVVGTAGYVMTEDCPGLNEPLYQYWSETKRDHLYNSDYDILGEGDGDYELVTDDNGEPVLIYVAIQ